MGDITSSCAIEMISGTGHSVSELFIETPATADTADTVVIDLSPYGASVIKHIEGYVHTTEDSVVVAEAPTTAVSSGTLTITVGGSTVSDKQRTYRVLVA